MTGRRSAFVLMAMLGAQGSLISAAIAEPVVPAAPPLVVADDQQAPAPDTSLRKRAEDLARAASERFSEIMAGGRKPTEQVAQGAAPTSVGPPAETGAIDEAFAPVWGWLARSAKDYENVIVAKLRNPSGDVVILAPQGTVVVAQKDAAPALPEKKPSELSEPRASEPSAGWSWDRVVEMGRDWLARANRSYRNEIVKKLVRPAQPSPDAVTQWPPAEVVPQAPAPADIAAEAEAEQHATEVRKAAEEAEAQRRRDAEAQKAAEEADGKRTADAEAKRVADEAEAKRQVDAEAQRIADAAEAKSKADAEAKRLADEADAKRKADEAKRVADAAETKRKADAETKRLADEAEAKRKADAEAKRVADAAEAKRKADAEAKRVADTMEAKRAADAEAKRMADAAETKRVADAETARRLKEESDTERKAVAESEATRLATEAEAKRDAAAGLKPAHENSSVAVVLPPRVPAKAPAAVEQDRKARKEVFVAEPEPTKIVKKKRRVAVAYDVRPKKHKHGQVVAHEHGHKHKYVLVEERRPKRIVHAYRQKSHGAPPIPVRNKVRKAPACACPRATRAPRLHHVRPYAAWHGARVAWRSCGDDSFVEAARWTHHRKGRDPNLIFHRPRLYISPERR